MIFGFYVPNRDSKMTACNFIILKNLQSEHMLL